MTGRPSLDTEEFFDLLAKFACAFSTASLIEAIFLKNILCRPKTTKKSEVYLNLRSVDFKLSFFKMYTTTFFSSSLREFTPASASADSTSIFSYGKSYLTTLKVHISSDTIFIVSPLSTRFYFISFRFNTKDCTSVPLLVTK